MNYLLDVNTLIALLWASHEHNERARLWLETIKNFAVCPLTELGFVRISTQPSFGVTVEQARKMLADWKAAKTPHFVPCDLEVLKTAAPKTGNKTTDYYLAALAGHMECNSPRSKIILDTAPPFPSPPKTTFTFWAANLERR